MAQPSTTDIIAPFDPTAYANITGAQLLQFLSGAIPHTDKGFIVVTADIAGVPQVPDATTTIKWQTYLWIRQSATAISAYIWNPAIGSDTTYQQWVNLNISALAIGSIIGAMIADFTISSDKIISLDASKLTGTLVGSPAVSGFIANNTAAGGDLTGLYPNPSVANVAITTSKIADNSVTHGKLGAKAVEIETDIKPAAVGLSLIRTNTGATALEHFVPNKVTLLANPASAGDVGKIVTVKNPYTDGFELTTPSTVFPSNIKAWAKFNGTSAGTNAPTSGNNVTSIQRVSAGEYIVNLTTAMPDINYCVLVTCGASTGESTWSVDGQTVSAFNIHTGRGSYIAEDRNPIFFTIIN